MDSYDVKEMFLKTIKENDALLVELISMASQTLEECKEEWIEQQESQDDINNPELHWEYMLDAERVLGKKLRRTMLNNAIDGFKPKIGVGFCIEATFFYQDFLLKILEEIDFRDIAEELLDIYKKDKKPVYLKDGIV